MSSTVQWHFIPNVKRHSGVSVCTSYPVTDSGWHTICQVSGTQEKSADIIMHWASVSIHTVTSFFFSFFLQSTPPVQTCLWWFAMLRWAYTWWWWWENDDDDDAQQGERPYSGYIVHLCSSQWPRCSLRTSCLGVWVPGSCIPDSAASHTGCCIRSIRSTRPSLHRLQHGEIYHISVDKEINTYTTCVCTHITKANREPRRNKWQAPLTFHQQGWLGAI